MILTYYKLKVVTFCFFLNTQNRPLRTCTYILPQRTSSRYFGEDTRDPLQTGNSTQMDTIQHKKHNLFFLLNFFFEESGGALAPTTVFIESRKEQS